MTGYSWAYKVGGRFQVRKVDVDHLNTKEGPENGTDFIYFLVVGLVVVIVLVFLLRR